MSEYVVLEAPSIFRWNGPKQGRTMFSATGGRLLLTNQRLVFTTRSGTDVIPLDQVTGCELTGLMGNLTLTYTSQDRTTAHVTFGTQQFGMPAKQTWVDAIRHGAAAAAGETPSSSAGPQTPGAGHPTPSAGPPIPPAGPPAPPPEPAPAVAMSPEEAARHLRELDQGGISATGPLPPAELHAYLHKVRTYLEVLPDRASLAASVLRAETEPDNPVELHNAGVALAGAARGIAIPVLYSALARGLDDPMTVQVLAHALGTRGRPHEAVSLYRQHPWALAEEQARASCAHFAAMAGDLATTREMAAQLSSTATADARQLALSRVARAEALHRRSRPPWGLREWVGVLHGSVLLHESPHGVEVMHGRYAALWDDDNRLAQVLGLLNQVLIRAGRQPARVVGGRDRDSQILAAIAEGLVRPVPGHGPSAATTLAVYYTWNPDDDDVLHRSEDPGTVLFAYSLDWTRGHELVPDVIGMEAQHVTPAWGERIRLGTDESGARASQTIPADDRSPEELGPELGVLLQAVSPDLDPSLSAVLSVVDALRDAGPACSGLLRGTRRPYHPGGPASSTQFG